MSVHTVLEDFVEQDQSAPDNFHWRHHTGESEAFLQCLKANNEKPKPMKLLVLPYLKGNHSRGEKQKYFPIWPYHSR